MGTSTYPFCVDLDGTLIRADLTVESLLVTLRAAPWLLFMLPIWLLRGRQHLKRELANRANIDVTRLPYHDGVLSFVRRAKESGRQVFLVTGSHQKFASQIHNHLGLFDDVLATNDSVNLTGRRKAEALVSRFGLQSYCYVADDWIDLHVWESAANVYSVGASARLRKRIDRMGKPHEIIQSTVSAAPAARTWLKAIRIHQWAKNALLFVPLITAHQLFEPHAFFAVTLGFLAFGFVASAGYIINDLLDLDADRRHPIKRDRPFASGSLSAKAGICACVILILAGIGMATLLPGPFLLVLLLYFLSTVSYSVWLKRVASLDVIVLAGLYTIRVIAGAFAASLPLSFWLLAFALFVFLCLALVKRVAELLDLSARSGDAGTSGSIAVSGREYSTSDAAILQTLGTSSGYIAVLVLALYINSPEVVMVYSTPELLWAIVPLLLLWVTRIWVVTTRGYMNDDPIVFAIKDPETWLTAGVTALILLAATKVTL